MSKLQINRLTEEDYNDFTSRFIFKGHDKSSLNHQVYLSDHSFSYSVLDLESERIIGLFGLSIAWAGVGEVWLMTTDYLNQNPLWLVKTFRKLTDEALEKGGLHRVQMFVDADNPKLRKWAETLGFTFEGILRKHSVEGKDHAVYSKIRKP